MLLIYSIHPLFAVFEVLAAAVADSFGSSPIAGGQAAFGVIGPVALAVIGCRKRVASMGRCGVVGVAAKQIQK
jgi:hypothetical protein